MEKWFQSPYSQAELDAAWDSQDITSKILFWAIFVGVPLLFGTIMLTGYIVQWVT